MIDTKQLGGKLTKELSQKLSTSSNWNNGQFQNLVKTQLAFNPLLLPKIIYKQIKNRKFSSPSQPLPVIPFDKNEFVKKQNDITFIWYGHSVLFMKINGSNILIDPMFGPNCSPVVPIPTKRFSNNTLDLINNLPDIDLVLMSHDHYDHLDLASIERLKHKTKNFFVALGVKRHLEAWGIESNKIKEFDWWEKYSHNDINITFTPTRHFSGRGIKDRQKSLWGGWSLKSSKHNIYFSGDSGYGPHFKEVGNTLGPFDIGFMECGQYSDYWRDIHMFPEESVQAAIDSKVSLTMPIHWAGFSLSFQHKWHEPADEFCKYAKEKNVQVITPKLGEAFSKSSKTEEWWHAYINI